MNHACTVHLALILGLGLSALAHALPEVGALEESLAVAEAATVDAEAELRRALTSHDPERIRTASTRLREIKQRRAGIIRDLQEARAERDRLEASEALRKRPALLRRLETLRAELDTAAAEYEEHPSGVRAARLRRLTVEELELRDELRKAEAAEGTGPP